MNPQSLLYLQPETLQRAFDVEASQPRRNGGHRHGRQLLALAFAVAVAAGIFWVVR